MLGSNIISAHFELLMYIRIGNTARAMYLNHEVVAWSGSVYSGPNFGYPAGSGDCTGLANC